jgi:shikimate kinase
LTSCIDRHIALIGFMGSGKSTVGPILADLLGVRFVDTDQCIENLTQKDIPRIFSEQGEEKFRQYESEVLKSLLRQSPKVIATGGGLVMRKINWDLLQQHTLTVYLKVPIDVLLTRISCSHDRPLAENDPGYVKTRSLFEQRVARYEQASLITDGSLPPYHIAMEIARKVRKG